jgi:predicted nucleic acid-binding protein
MYALDTITVLDYFKCKGGVGAKLQAVPPGEAALPAVAAYEVWGAYWVRTALAHGATLVTRNVREFGRVPGLTVVNWHDG